METFLTVLAVVATATICGLGFRIRGGLWNTKIEQYIHWGATTARLVAWATPTAILGTLWYGLAWYWLAALLIAAWIGCLPGWYGSIDMGRNEGTWLRDFVVITIRGAFWTLPISAVYAAAGLTVPAVGLLLVGAAMGIWYELGWRTPSSVPGFNQGTELGELYFGLMFGLVLSVLALV